MSPSKYTRHPDASNYCILFGGYRKDSTLALSYEFIFIFTHFLIAMVLVFLYMSPFIQAILILVLCILLLIYTIAIRPFQFTVVLVFEIITQILLIIALIGLVISTNYEKSGCFTCANREGFLCYLILAMLFLYLLLLALGLLIFAFLAGCCGHKMFYKNKHIPEDISGSGGQNLSGLAGIDNISKNVYTYNEGMVNNNMTGAMAGTMVGGTMVAGYNHMVNSNTKYDDKVYKEVIINEEKNESYKNTVNEGIIDENALSQTEETIIGKNDTLMDSDEEEEIEEYHSNLRNRNEKTIHEFNQDIRDRVTREGISAYEGNMQYMNTTRGNVDNSLLDRTLNMKVDTDDERIKQNKVLHALSMSDINMEDIEDNKNQIYQAKKEIEIKKRNQMLGNNMGYDDSDLDMISRRHDQDIREFKLAYNHDNDNDGFGFENRDVMIKKFDEGSDYGTDKDYLSDTNVVKTRVHSQAVQEEFTSGLRDGGNYYHKKEYNEYSQNRNN
jgi:hypothetical protein